MKTEGVQTRKTAAEESFSSIVSQISTVPSEPTTPLEDLERKVEAFLKSKSPYQMMVIPLELVETDENIRHLEEELADPEFKSLVASIQKVGVIQPATLRVVKSSEVLTFQCVAGHRRIRAARIAVPSLKSMNFLVRKFESDNLQLVTTVIENTHRKALHPFDLAKAVRRLSEQGMSFPELEHLFERDQWNLRRFDKMNDWNDISRSLVLENPTRFTSSFLVHLASKTLTVNEVETEIRKKLGLTGVTSRRKPLADRLRDYTREKNLTREQVSLVQQVLIDLGLIKEISKRGGGRRKATAISIPKDSTNVPDHDEVISS